MPQPTSNYAAPVGDPGFLGIDMRDPANLAPGWVSSASNVRFNFGRAESREGILQCWKGVVPHGAGVFDDPDGVRWLIAAVDGACYRWRQGSALDTIPLPLGITITGSVRFVQAFDSLFMLRGVEATTLVMDDFAVGFRLVDNIAVSHAGNGTGTAPIPNSAQGIFFQNRFVMVAGLDQVAVSDILNYTRYALADSFRINTGSGDSITGIYEFSETSVVVAKERSIHLISNLVPNEYGNYANATRQTITAEYGVVAPRSMVQLGADLVGLSRRGVITIRQTETNQLQSTDVALSDPIQPIIDRINWQYAAGAAGAVLGGRYYLAVPLDKAEMVGENLLSQLQYDLAGHITLTTLTPGQRYRYTPAGTATSIVIGATTTTGTALDFTAATGVSPVIHGTVGARCMATIQPVWLGVNNAVLVFNTKTPGWESVDTSPALMVKDWVRFELDGRERLYFLGIDGSMNLFEEGTEDDVWRPIIASRIDLLVAQLPAVGDTFATGFFYPGTTVTVTRSRRNTANTWGCRDITTAIANLWSDEHGSGGCNPQLAHTWIRAGTELAPGTAWAEQIPGGVRLVGAEAWPTITGTWCTNRGPTMVSDKSREPIISELVTRGYHFQNTPWTDFSRAWFSVATWASCLSLAYRTDGQAEETIAIPEIRPDRLKYVTHGTPDHVQTNVNDDHELEGRQDYSVLATSAGFYLGSGINFDAMQDSRRAMRCPERGRFLQCVIRNTQGRLALRSVEIECSPGTRRGGAQY